MGVSATGGTYGTVFTNLPSDTQERYTLTAGLFSGIFTPGELADSGYSNLDQKVGEGVSAAFSIAPGENKTITLVINAVGEMTFASTATTIDNANPTFTAGDTTAKGQIALSAAMNPSATALKYYVLNAANATQSVATLTSSEWASPPAKTSLPFTAPSTAGTYRLVADLVKGDEILSRRIRPFTVAAQTAELTMRIHGENNNLLINNAHIVEEWSVSYSIPVSAPTATITFTNDFATDWTFYIQLPTELVPLNKGASVTRVLPVNGQGKVDFEILFYEGP
ncbi:hypothetical protein D3C87_1037640 [compost metagenome]